MARWTVSAKWAAGPALDGLRDMPLALRLSEGLGRTRHAQLLWIDMASFRLGRPAIERTAVDAKRSEVSFLVAPEAVKAFLFLLVHKPITFRMFS